MFVMHMALGGCLKAPPVAYGLTEDTGGHIAYVLGAVAEQSRMDVVRRVSIVTRAFEDATLGACYAAPREVLGPKAEIVRLRTARRDYLAKDDLEAELPAIEAAFLSLLGAGPRPDVIHAHFADAACIALEARRRWGIPVVYTPHSLGLGKRGALPSSAGGALARRIARERRAIAEADAIVVSSRDEAEAQIEGYGTDCLGRVHRVNPGVYLVGDTGGTDRARALIDPYLFRPDLPLVLAVARPVAKKNLGALVEAYATTPGLRDLANLAVVAGQADDPSGRPVREALARAVAAHGLGGSVALPPRHRSGDVPQLYRLAARRRGVFVNPALHEPFGLTVLEAAAARLPVVVTDRGGPRDIVAAIGHGVCVAPDDLRAIGGACLAAVTDAAAWTARSAAAARGIGRYSWRAYAGRTVEIYDRLAHPPACAIPARPDTLLTCDIDGTLTGDRDAAHRFAAWIEERRCAFTVATGRSLPEARRVLAAWGLPEPACLITSVGTEVWHADGAGRATLDQGYAASISRGWDADAVSAALLDAGAIPQDAVEQRRWKRSFLGDAAEAARLAEVLARASLAARVVASHGTLIDVLPRRAGKAAAMAYVAHGLGIPRGRRIAAGDSGNDLCMLEAAGVAILPANALAELDGLRPRGRVLRSPARHAAGVLDALARLGLARPARRRDGTGRHVEVRA